MMAAALVLICYNMWEAHHAESSSAAALDQLISEIRAKVLLSKVY